MIFRVTNQTIVHTVSFSSRELTRPRMATKSPCIKTCRLIRVAYNASCDRPDAPRMPESVQLINRDKRSRASFILLDLSSASKHLESTSTCLVDRDCWQQTGWRRAPIAVRVSRVVYVRNVLSRQYQECRAVFRMCEWRAINVNDDCFNTQFPIFRLAWSSLRVYSRVTYVEC